MSTIHECYICKKHVRSEFGLPDGWTRAKVDEAAEEWCPECFARVRLCLMQLRDGMVPGTYELTAPKRKPGRPKKTEAADET